MASLKGHITAVHEEYFLTVLLAISLSTVPFCPDLYHLHFLRPYPLSSFLVFLVSVSSVLLSCRHHIPGQAIVPLCVPDHDNLCACYKGHLGLLVVKFIAHMWPSLRLIPQGNSFLLLSLPGLKTQRGCLTNSLKSSSPTPQLPIHFCASFLGCSFLRFHTASSHSTSQGNFWEVVLSPLLAPPQYFSMSPAVLPMPGQSRVHCLHWTAWPSRKHAMLLGNLATQHVFLSVRRSVNVFFNDFFPQNYTPWHKTKQPRFFSGCFIMLTSQSPQPPAGSLKVVIWRIGELWGENQSPSITNSDNSYFSSDLPMQIDSWHVIGEEIEVRFY